MFFIYQFFYFVNFFFFFLIKKGGTNRVLLAAHGHHDAQAVQHLDLFEAAVFDQRVQLPKREGRVRKWNFYSFFLIFQHLI